MCSRAECQRHVGRLVRFRSPYGYHEGVIERISGTKAIILSPRNYIPVQLAAEDLDVDEAQRLDAALAWGGYGPGYGAGGGYGGGAGYGGWAGYGWARWAVSFLVIFLLWGLWW